MPFPEARNLNLFGNWATADVISEDEVILQEVARVLLRRGEETHRQRPKAERCVMTEAKLGR